MPEQKEYPLTRITHKGIEQVTFTATMSMISKLVLCYQDCAKFKPNKPDNCKLAQRVYETTIGFQCRTPVIACPQYEDATGLNIAPVREGSPDW